MPSYASQIFHFFFGIYCSLSFISHTFAKQRAFRPFSLYDAYNISRAISLSVVCWFIILVSLLPGLYRPWFILLPPYGPRHWYCFLAASASTAAAYFFPLVTRWPLIYIIYYSQSKCCWWHFLFISILSDIFLRYFTTMRADNTLSIQAKVSW